MNILVTLRQAKELYDDLRDRLKKKADKAHEHVAEDIVDLEEVLAKKPIGQAVTAERDRLNNIIDETYSTKFESSEMREDMTALVSEEASRAEAAEEELGTKVIDEASRAAVAENALDTRITAETSRIESNLGSRITSETARATNAEASLGTKIDNETQARVNAISSLNYSGSQSGYYVTQVTETSGVVNVTREPKGTITSGSTGLVDGGSVYSHVSGVKTAVETKITTEKERAEAAEEELGTSITDEVTRATASENELDGNISAEATRAKAAEKENKDSISAEATRAKAAEKENKDSISAEATRAKAEEGTLTTNLASEVTRATEAEEELGTKITAEESRAKGAESLLSGNISAETTRAKAEEGTLTTNLASEVTRAESAESTLTTNLASEVTRAKAEEKRIEGLVTSLDGKVDSVDETASSALETAQQAVSVNQEQNTRISNLESSSTSAGGRIDQVESNLASEVTRAESAESTLTTNLASEVTRATEAEGDLTDRINSETEARAAAISSAITTHVHGNIANNGALATGNSAVVTDASGKITTGKISNPMLTNNSITLGDTSVSLGGTIDSISGLASIEATTLSGNATTASAFNSTREISLNGNITGSASSNGESGWSITTTLSDDAVTSDKIADNAVTADKIASGVIGNGKLTIKRGSDVAATFYANQNNDVEIDVGLADTLWGNISGDIEDQSDLKAILDDKVAYSDIVDNTSTDDSSKPLSAKMGKALQDDIDSLKSRGRFLSLWDATIGKAETEPFGVPYSYNSGDYFIVSSVGENNFRPYGTEYTGVASTVVEEDEIAKEDTYYFDGTVWSLQSNTKKTVLFSEIAGEPSDNSNLSAALNNKASALSLELHTSNQLNPHRVTAAQIGLDKVTNDKQIKGLTTVTENHVVTFGENGYTVKDSGYTIEASVPADAKFTDTIMTVSANGAGNAVTSMYTSDNNIVFVRGSTFLVADDIAGKENTSNKATAWSDSPTDVQYPSAKLVKDSLSEKSDVGHTHDDRYYTESEIDSKLAATYSKPEGGIPKTDLSNSVQTSLGKADTALQEHQSLSGYATEQWVTNKGYTTNVGTITGITMNGATKGSSGIVDLGTVITDISGKQDNLSQTQLDAVNSGITSAKVAAYDDYATEKSDVGHTHDDRYYTESEVDSKLAAKVTYIPSVSEEGIISWTNEAGAENPDPVNIKGPAGETGPQGIQGEQGEKGDAGVYSYDSISEFPAEGEDHRLYCDKSQNLLYRWDGTEYIEMTADLSPIEDALARKASLHVGDEEPTGDESIWVDTDDNSDISLLTVPVGTILPYSGSGTPYGYLLCDGHSESKTTYPALFAVIGYTYGGSGDNFNLPNLSGRFLEGSSVAGTVKEAGLPNITGSLDLANNEATFDQQFIGTGVITSKRAARNVATGDGTYNGWTGFDFDASKNGTDPIYGKSTTVQPPSVTVRYIIKAYNSVTTETAEVEIEAQIATVERRIEEIHYSNPNLLDNPFFTVNQREATSVSGNYGVDRFIGFYSVVSNGLSLATSNYIIQPIEDSIKTRLNGKTLTFSVLFSDGTIESGSAVYSPTSWVSYVVTDRINAQNTDTGGFAVTARASVVIRAIKVEYGTKSTLSYDHEPDYATELLKCQRYYQIIYNALFKTRGTITTGVKDNAGFVFLPVEFATTMRGHGAVSLLTTTVSGATVSTGDIALTLQDMSYWGASATPQGLKYLTFSANSSISMASGTVCQTSSDYPIIAISADL